MLFFVFLFFCAVIIGCFLLVALYGAFLALRDSLRCTPPVETAQPIDYPETSQQRARRQFRAKCDARAIKTSIQQAAIRAQSKDGLK